MTDLHDAWLAKHRARWLRPDARLFARPDAHPAATAQAKRWLRPDWTRWLQPGFAPVYLALLEGKANFNPSQPRVPKGNPGGGQWTDDEGGGGGRAAGEWDEPGTDGRALDDEGGAGNGAGDEDESDDDSATDFSAARVRYRIVGLPEPLLSQLGRLVDANMRFDQAAGAIRRIDPTWNPRGRSITDPNSNEGIIGYAEARALEAEAYARRLGIGGNFGPPLESPPFGTSLPTMRPFHGPAWIDAYRTLANSNDLFGREIWSRDKGTVAVTNFNGTPLFGVNKESPTYTSADLETAFAMRNLMIEKYSNMRSDNTGQMPNDAVFHAEITILTRAARANGGNLQDRTLEVHVDRPLCWSCGEVLPNLGKELGNPAVTFIHTHTGTRRTMWSGRWLD